MNMNYLYEKHSGNYMYVDTTDIRRTNGKLTNKLSILC